MKKKQVAHSILRHTVRCSKTGGSTAPLDNVFQCWLKYIVTFSFPLCSEILLVQAVFLTSSFIISVCSLVLVFTSIRPCNHRYRFPLSLLSSRLSKHSSLSFFLNILSFGLQLPQQSFPGLSPVLVLCYWRMQKWTQGSRCSGWFCVDLSMPGRAK